MHQNSLLLFEKHAKGFFRSGQRVLEIGPAGVPSAYQQSVGNDSIIWDTLDIADDPQLTYPAAPEYAYPIDDNTYDLVFSAQVMEHIPRVWTWLEELVRVCRPDRLVVTIIPASWPYHEAPVDCWRAFPMGMSALYEHCGLSVLLSEVESIEGERFRKQLPGRGLDAQKLRRRVVGRLLAPFGHRVECAFDTITIGRKTAPTGAR